jgi:hypothetical protein
VSDQVSAHQNGGVTHDDVPDDGRVTSVEAISTSKEHVTERSDGPFRCPCCGFKTLAEQNAYEICPICLWEDDGQDDTDADSVRGGPNGGLSLTQARANYEASDTSLAGRDPRLGKHQSGPGFIYVNDRRVMRIPGWVLVQTWESFWMDANRRLGTRWQDNEGESLSGDLLLRFAELASVFARSLPSGAAHAVLEGLGELCLRTAREGGAVWIET